MPEYSISWNVEIDAETPVHAAFAALALQRDPTSWATVFTVHTDDGDVVGVPVRTLSPAAKKGARYVDAACMTLRPTSHE